MRFVALIFFVFISCLVQAQIHKGGNGNGFGVVVISNLTLGFSDSTFNGGNGNGFNTANTAPFPFGITNATYNGGNGNGFGTTLLAASLIGIVDSMYNGGNGRGDAILTTNLDLTTCGVLTRWNGAVSNSWSDGANWDCGVAPGVNSNVIIPAGLSRYPTVFSNAEIKGILVQTGATLTIRPGVQLKMNGQ